MKEVKFLILKMTAIYNQLIHPVIILSPEKVTSFKSFPSWIFSLLIHLTIIFSINRLVVWSKKCQKIKEILISKPKVISSSFLLCPHPKDTQFTFIVDLKKNRKYSYLRSWNHRIWTFCLKISSISNTW